MPDRNNTSASEDTIVAIITPPGEGGIAALRLSGRNSRSLLAPHLKSVENSKVELSPFMLKLCLFVDRNGTAIDEITAVFMPYGKSYTGLDQVEIFCHGGRQVVQTILNELLASGARAAEPGEFTRLAFENGRIDLAKAEAVAELISANTRHSYEVARSHLLGDYSEHILQLREQLVSLLAEVEASIDYPEEEIEPSTRSVLLDSAEQLVTGIKELAATYRGGKIVSEGFTIAIAGRPNSGKSSLFNLLLKQERALVTPTAGTTRDYLRESIDLDGYMVHLTDTAGLRRSGGKIEKAGQASAQKIIKEADLVLWLCDLSRKNVLNEAEADVAEINHKNVLIIGNKCDLFISNKPTASDGAVGLAAISCKTKAGIKELKKRLVRQIESNLPDLTSGIVVTSARHAQKLRAAIQNIKSARQKILQNETPELTAFDLRSAASAIDEITGRICNDDILDKIFAKFCIGK